MLTKSCPKAQHFTLLIYVSKPCCFIGTLLQLSHLLTHFNQHLKFVIKLHHFFLHSYIILAWIQHLIDFTWLCQNSLSVAFFQKGYLIWNPLSVYFLVLRLFIFSSWLWLSPMNFAWDPYPSQSCSADEHHLHLRTSCLLGNHFLFLLTLSALE